MNTKKKLLVIAKSAHSEIGNWWLVNPAFEEQVRKTIEYRMKECDRYRPDKLEAFGRFILFYYEVRNEAKNWNLDHRRDRDGANFSKTLFKVR